MQWALWSDTECLGGGRLLLESLGTRDALRHGWRSVIEMGFLLFWASNQGHAGLEGARQEWRPGRIIASPAFRASRRYEECVQGRAGTSRVGWGEDQRTSHGDVGAAG
ncbi:unnamed protein product [Ostreobium quekettii]|uniref:Uncharacterized protein n=1 Tax=Ostreobium quekettii TaxID=121088 RepID=A0A8S1J1B0_9CHLO|nr:unnamed protein product [Ostreobium quekettii]